ncbi:hypothetical protein J6590_002799 [Homalodisca vitripennis]|nr:hypothetical protein J6590_002799 [Homalodisca vitripennis]
MTSLFSSGSFTILYCVESGLKDLSALERHRHTDHRPCHSLSSTASFLPFYGHRCTTTTCLPAALVLTRPDHDLRVTFAGYLGLQSRVIELDLVPSDFTIKRPRILTRRLSADCSVSGQGQASTLSSPCLGLTPARHSYVTYEHSRSTRCTFPGPRILTRRLNADCSVSGQGQASTLSSPCLGLTPARHSYVTYEHSRSTRCTFPGPRILTRRLSADCSVSGQGQASTLSSPCLGLTPARHSYVTYEHSNTLQIVTTIFNFRRSTNELYYLQGCS